MKLKLIKKAAMLSLMAFCLLFTQVESAQSKMPAIPQCGKAWNTLKEKKSLRYVQALLQTNCQVLYTKKWFLGKGVSNPKVCGAAWSALAKRKMLGAANALLTRNCPVLYKVKWLKIG